MNTTTNQMPITVITSTIALMAFLCVLTICLLSYLGVKVPPELNTLTGGLVGALTAMLVKTSPTETLKTTPYTSPISPDQPPTPVVIAQPADAPVPVTETVPTESKP